MSRVSTHHSPLLEGMMVSTPTIRKSTCSICNPLTNCGLDVQVLDGHIVSVSGSPETPGSQGRLCIKGKATVEFVHNPERLLYPMKRVGERGSGRWERIGWDDALDL